MGAKMRVVIIRAEDEHIEVKEDFEHSLENMQKVVGGYLEAIPLVYDKPSNITIWLNDEGKLQELRPNFAIVKGESLLDYIAGDVIITSVDKEGNTVGLSDGELELVKERFDFSRGLISPIFVNKILMV